MSKMNSDLISHIEKFHRSLNQVDVVPRGCYQRSSIYYRLVCCINNMIGLYMSSNFESIPVFINRAYKEIRFLKGISEGEGKEIPAYFSFALRYLRLMGEFCFSLNVTLKSRIPKELLQGEMDLENI